MSRIRNDEPRAARIPAPVVEAPPAVTTTSAPTPWVDPAPPQAPLPPTGVKTPSEPLPALSTPSEALRDLGQGFAALVPETPPEQAPAPALALALPALTETQILVPLDAATIAAATEADGEEDDPEMGAMWVMLAQGLTQTQPCLANKQMAVLPPPQQAEIAKLAALWPILLPPPKKAGGSFAAAPGDQSPSRSPTGDVADTHDDVRAPAGFSEGVSRLLGIGGVDIMALVQLVLFEVGREATRDLNELVQQMREMNKKKAAMRELISAAKAERAKMETELRRKYDERCRLPETDPRYIDPGEVTFDDFKQSQMLEMAGLPDPSAPPPEGYPEWGVSPNEVHYDQDAATPYEYEQLAAQLQISSEEMMQLAAHWSALPESKKASFGSMYAWLVTPVQQGGVGLRASPDQSQSELVANYLAIVENQAAGEAEGDAFNMDAVTALYGISEGEARALSDYWNAIGEEGQAQWGGDPTRFMEEAVGLGAGKDNDGKVSAFFYALDEEHLFGDGSISPPSSAGNPINANDAEGAWAQAENNAAQADAIREDGIPGVDMGTLDDLLRDFLTLSLKAAHYAAEHDGDHGPYGEQLGEARAALESFLQGVQPNSSKNLALEYVHCRVQEVRFEVLYAQKLNQGTLYHEEILGGSTQDGEHGLDLYFRSEYLDMEVGIDGGALDEIEDGLWGWDGTLDDVEKWNYEDMPGEDVVSAFINGCDDPNSPYYSPPDNTNMDGPGGFAAEAPSDDHVEEEAAFLDSLFTEAVQKANPPHYDVPEVSLAEVSANIEAWENQKDSLSELSEELSLRLQMFVDRRQKVYETISNVVKKASDTGQSIIGNMK